MSEKLFTNLFEIENQNDLTVEYRILAIRNLPNDEREKNLQLLKTNIAYDLREPVALIRHDGVPSLVLPASAKLPELRQQLTPHVVELEPAFDTQMLDFSALTAQNTGIAIEFLSYSLRGSLMRRNDLWKSGNGWFRKQADESASNDDVAVYPGFSWQVVEHGNGRLHIALASSVRYVDSKWLSERYNALNPQEFRNEHCLYHFGDQWYPIQILSVCPLSIGEQQFKLDGGGTATVLAYTKTKHPRNARVAALDASSPAITYRYPNRPGLTRYGSLALCKRTMKTDEIGGARREQIHNRAALKPQRRVHLASRDIREFTGAKLGGIPLRIGKQPLEVERKIFPVPALRFGHERVLRTDDASLHQYPRERQRLLESPNAGPLMRDPLAAQYIILPQSLPRDRRGFSHAHSSPCGGHSSEARLSTAAGGLRRRARADSSAADAGHQ